jgi:putative tricarboxylic transport membrane protein
VANKALKKVSQAGKGELAFAGSLFLASLVVFWDTSGLILPTNNTIVSPRTFPYTVATLLMITSIGVMVQVLRGREATPEGVEPGTPFQKADFSTMAVIVLAIGLHAFLIERTGYIISATISFWGVAYAFGVKKMLRLGIFAFLFSLVVYFGFTELLDIRLPQWILEDFISSLGRAS